MLLGSGLKEPARLLMLLADKRPFRENDFDFFSGRFTAISETTTSSSINSAFDSQGKPLRSC